MCQGASRCHNVRFLSYYLPIFVQGALKYICSMFIMYLNLNYLWTWSSGLPFFRRPVDVQISTKCIYDVSPHPCEHVGLFNSFLSHPWAEKLTYKWTKLFAYFGTFDFQKYVFLFERVHSQSRWNASFDSFVQYTAQGWRRRDLNIPTSSSGLAEVNWMQKPDGWQP